MICLDLNPPDRLSTEYQMTDFPPPRRKTSQVKVGNVLIGGNAPISIQSMTTEKTSHIDATLAQIRELKNNFVQIVRIAVLDQADVDAVAIVARDSELPVITDIHYNANFALSCLEANIHGLRLNPGNIKEKKDVMRIISVMKEKKIPLRIGVNSGSIDRGTYSSSSAQNLVASAERHIEICESMDFYDLKVSLKSTDVRTMVEANRIFAKKYSYPLHLGVTEAGGSFTSAIRSSIGLGSLLLEGIGDTVRVSTSGDPVQEGKIAHEILLSLGLRSGVKIIGCPTCGRVNVDVASIVNLLEKEIYHLPYQIKIAVLGCIVNGLGEAQDADITLVGVKDKNWVFVSGKKVQEIPQTLSASETVNILKEIILTHFDDRKFSHES